MKTKKTDTASELAEKLLATLETRRGGAHHASPLTLQHLVELTDPHASPDLVAKAIAKKPFKERAILVSKGNPASLVALAEDIAQLTASDRLLEIVLEQLCTPAQPLWPLAKVKAAIENKSLRKPFEIAVAARIRDNTIPATVGCRFEKNKPFLFLHRIPPPPPPKKPEELLAEQLLATLTAQRQLGSDAYPLPLRRLIDLTNPQANATLVKKALAHPSLNGKVVLLDAKKPGSPVALAEDRDQFVASDLVLEFLLRAKCKANEQAFPVESLLAKKSDLYHPFVAAVKHQIEAGSLPPTVGWMWIGKKQQVFFFEHIQHCQPQPERAAPIPVPPIAPTTTPADFARSFDEAFQQIDRHKGGHNFVSLVDLRQRLPLAPETFNAELRKLRIAGRYTLSAAEGRHGVSPEEQSAAIVEDGSLMLYVSPEDAMTAQTSEPRTLERAMDDLENFFALVRSSNPFIDNRVNGLSGNTVSIDDIHRAAFERLTALAHSARDLRRGLGAMLWGEAGIGKSHLLGRLIHWAENQQQAVAAYLHNLQASPENLPRSLLKSVVGTLTRGQASHFAATPLYELVFALVKESLRHDESMPHPWRTVLRAWSDLVDQLSAEDFARAAPVDRTVYNVLFRFFHSVYRAPKTGDERVAALAVRWLSGDYLDPDQAQALELPPCPSRDTPVALADNQQIKQVLVALSRMALSSQQPFLLCFDQVDNLDDVQGAALARFLEAVIDSSPNLLVVTGGIQATLVRWHETKVIQDSAWDRLAQFQLHLQRLSPAEGRHIVAARLEKSLTPFTEIDKVHERLQMDHLFPLGRAWVDEFFRDKIALRPRDVVNGAREGWQRQQEALRKAGGSAWLDGWGKGLEAVVINPSSELSEEQIQKAIDTEIDQKMMALIDQRRQRSGILQSDASQLVGLVAALLPQIGRLEIDRPPSGQPDRQCPFDLLVRQHQGENGKAVQTGLRFLVNNSATSTTAALRWLTEIIPGPDRILLITYERYKLAFGAQSDAKGREYYAELQQREVRRFAHIVLTFEQNLQLMALQEVVGLARGGDLELAVLAGTTHSISEQEVIASHHRRGRYAALPLLRDFLVSPH